LFPPQKAVGDKGRSDADARPPDSTSLSVVSPIPGSRATRLIALTVWRCRYEAVLTVEARCPGNSRPVKAGVLRLTAPARVCRRGLPRRRSPWPAGRGPGCTRASPPASGLAIACSAAAAASAVITATRRTSAAPRIASSAASSRARSAAISAIASRSASSRPSSGAWPRLLAWLRFGVLPGLIGGGWSWLGRTFGPCRTPPRGQA
jgi:hypothetical protein